MELLIANRFGGVERVRVIGAVAEVKPLPQPTEAPPGPGGVVDLFEIQNVYVLAGSQFAFFQPRFNGTAKVRILPQATGILSGSAQTIGGTQVNVTGQLRGGIQLTAGQWHNTSFDITKDTVYALAFSTACQLTVQVIGKPGIVGTEVDTVTIAGGVVVQGALTDDSGSITTGGTAQELAAANASRRYLLIQNPLSATTQGIATAESLFFNFTTTAVEGEPSIELAPGDIFVMDRMAVSTEAISVIAATTGHKFTAKEM